MDHATFMRQAIKKAKEGIAAGQTPFGSCIVKDGDIISCEHNIVLASTEITAHAEVNAIRTACKKLNSINLSGSVLYSTCEPCPMCFSACHWARVEKILYGARIADAQNAGFNELAISCEAMKVLGGSTISLEKDFLKDECTALFQEWKRSNGQSY